jgi:quercetin dioxygenase-like cupin family protein
VSHPDPLAPPDRRPIEPGEVLENPVTRERAVALELPWQNPEGRAVAELTALPGARVPGEHLHPSLHERFTVERGELTVVRDGRRMTLHAGESADIEPGTWHDWWNESDADAVVRVEVTPGERFVHLPLAHHARAPLGARRARLALLSGKRAGRALGYLRQPLRR